MPHIAVTMYPGRSKEIKTDLAYKIQNFVAQELQIPTDVVSVSIEDIEKEKWDDHIKSIPEEIVFVKPNY